MTPRLEQRLDQHRAGCDAREDRRHATGTGVVTPAGRSTGTIGIGRIESGHAERCDGNPLRRDAVGCDDFSGGELRIGEHLRRGLRASTVERATQPIAAIRIPLRVPLVAHIVDGDDDRDAAQKWRRIRQAHESDRPRPSPRPRADRPASTRDWSAGAVVRECARGRETTRTRHPARRSRAARRGSSSAGTSCST